MKAKHQRLILILISLVIASLAVKLILRNFQDNLLFFYSPTEFIEKGISSDKKVRIGGIVKDNSLVKATDSLKVEFIIADFKNEIKVEYEGILPALFREGQGMVANGNISDNGVFIATELLAKHDENYMPPEVAKALEDSKYNNYKYKKDSKGNIE